MKTKNIIFYLIGLLAFSSCQDMFEPADENNRQLEDLTEESRYAHGLLMYAYDRLPYLTTSTTDIATDDATSNQPNATLINMATGSWAADNNPMSQWDACKDGIQYVNLFLTIADKVKWAPSAKSKQQMFVDRLIGEGLTLRAIFYYHLIMAHGGYADDGQLYGVPLLTEPEDGSSDFNQPRALFADCVKQCFADCDSAIALLPNDYKEITDTLDIPLKYRKMGAILSNYNAVFGSKSKNLISAKVALAVKAQTALLAASPAFREGYAAQCGDTMTVQKASEQAARFCAAALKAIGGMEGFDKNGNIWYKIKSSIDNNADIAEVLWREDTRKNASQESDNFPPSLYGKGRINPSQNLVDAFPMRSGLPITDANSGYDDQDPYTGRDPRLANIVLFNGVTFRKSEIITGNYANAEGKNTDNLNQDNATRTGYYLLKLLRDDVNPLQSNLVERNHYYTRIRYTELFLAYAEAANDAWGPKDARLGYSAYDVIKAIRERAGLATNEIGMPLPEGDVYLEDCASDQAKMTDLIRNERRIELCFENKRFWDLRRWKMPLNESLKGMKISLKDATKEATPDNIKYEVFEVEVRAYKDYQCYGPIPRGELLKWSNLRQNNGWE